jgi:serine protease Do
VIKDFRTGELKKQAVIGSGIIFHPDGYVVTNYHVAGKAERIICTLHDKEQVPAEYIGGDPSTDVAVLKLDLDEYSAAIFAAELGDSDSAQAGQHVLAMGSPLSLSRSISSGVISTKDRYFSSEYRLPSGERTGRYNLWIQTDAAINPGNSGGPLVDLAGRVIGINSRATFLANNLGFAIPINIVKQVIEQVLDHGRVIRSWIGVECQALQELENWFGAERNNGVLVASVMPGSPADQRYLKAGDIILALDGEPVSARFVEELPAFYNTIASYAPGSEVNLSVLRNEQEYEFTVTTVELGDLQGEDFEAADWGFTVKAITQQMRVENQLVDTLGVYATGVKRVGPADLAGLRRGDVVTMINKTTISGLADFMQVYSELMESGSDKVLVRLNRNGAIRLAVLSVDSREEGSNDES